MQQIENNDDKKDLQKTTEKKNEHNLCKEESIQTHETTCIKYIQGQARKGECQYSKAFPQKTNNDINYQPKRQINNTKIKELVNIDTKTSSINILDDRTITPIQKRWNIIDKKIIDLEAMIVDMEKNEYEWENELKITKGSMSLQNIVFSLQYSNKNSTTTTATNTSTTPPFNDISSIEPNFLNTYNIDDVIQKMSIDIPGKIPLPYTRNINMYNNNRAKNLCIDGKTILPLNTHSSRRSNRIGRHRYHRMYSQGNHNDTFRSSNRSHAVSRKSLPGMLNICTKYFILNIFH